MTRPLLLLLVVSVLLGALVPAGVDGDSLATVEEALAGSAVVGADAEGPWDGDEDGIRRGTMQRAIDAEDNGRDDPSKPAEEAELRAAVTAGDGPDRGGEPDGDADPGIGGIDADRSTDVGGSRTDPLAEDPDDDGLGNDVEEELGTDPRDPDTDGDGFSDGQEVDRTDVLPGPDPLRVDVYVEVDAVEGASLPRSEVGRVVSEYADAPVGPDEARGIGLHVAYDETGLDDRGPVSVTGRPDSDGDETVTVGAYAADHYDYRGYGYHYLLVVPEVQDVSRAEVLGEAGDGELVVQAEERSDVRGSTLMHELGHSLGLDRDDFDGIDAYEFTAEEYPSVMNYNTGTTFYGYSAGDPFDDWAAIVDDLHVPDTSELEANQSDGG